MSNGAFEGTYFICLSYFTILLANPTCAYIDYSLSFDHQRAMSMGQGTSDIGR
jgi:hypothetical protein